MNVYFFNNCEKCHSGSYIVKKVTNYGKAFGNMHRHKGRVIQYQSYLKKPPLFLKSMIMEETSKKVVVANNI